MTVRNCNSCNNKQTKLGLEMKGEAKINTSPPVKWLYTVSLNLTWQNWDVFFKTLTMRNFIFHLRLFSSHPQKCLQALTGFGCFLKFVFCPQWYFRGKIFEQYHRSIYLSKEETHNIPQYWVSFRLSVCQNSITEMSCALVKVDVVVGEGHHASVIITSVWQ